MVPLMKRHFFEKVGIQRLMALRADPYSGVSLQNRGYYDE